MFDAYTLNTLIKEHGQTISFKKRDMSSYNPDTGGVTETSVDYFVKAYPYGISNILTDFSIDNGDQIFAISHKLINGCDTPDVDVDDQIVSGTKTYDVVKVKRIVSAGRTLIYMAQVKD